jgi:dTDP-4-dehydrorhamnose reductase
MTAAIVGAGGQLGRAMSTVLPDAVVLTRADLDIVNARAVAAHDWSGVDVLLNAAAYTAVDQAETPEGRVAAWAANATAVAHLAAAANNHGMTLVHVSTEYVFDGYGSEPFTEDAPLCPLSSYGASKAAGDVAAAVAARHYIVRTTWVTGEGANFVRTMLGLAARGVSPVVVADQIGRLTFADDLAAGIVALIERRTPHGVYNLTNTGDPGSWADVARATFELAGYPASRVTDTTTAAYCVDKPQAARRPRNSVLDLDKARTAGIVLPPWRQSLIDYIKQETKQEAAAR